MTTPRDAMPEPVDEPPGAPAGRRSRWQFGLRAMLTLTALVAVWTAHVNNVREIHSLEGRIDALRPLVRDLDIPDPSFFAFVKLDALWFDDNRWDLYVPDGPFRVCLATRGIEWAGFPADFRWRPLSPGRHTMELRQSGDADAPRISVLVDGSPLMEAVETKDWSPNADTSTSEMSQGNAASWGRERCMFSFRRRFLVPQGDGSSAAPAGPGNGTLLWIERYDPDAPGPGGDSSKTPTGRAASPSPTSYLE